MIPSSTNPKWRELAQGRIAHNFQLVAASMLISRVSRGLKDSPSEEKVQSAIGEVRAFFEKYEGLLAQDLATIFK